MTTLMTFPRTRPQQSTLLSFQQTASQQTGLDISSILNLMLPMMIIVMMMKMMTSATSGFGESLKTA
jgi:hypothetical protein